MKLTKKQMLGIGGAFVVVVLTVIAVTWWNAPSTEGFEEKTTDKEASSGKLWIFLADWCPHCTSFKPLLPKLEEGIKEMGVEMRTLNIDEPESKPVMERMGVKSFPTLKFETPSGNIETFSGNRDVDAILTWLAKDMDSS